MWTTTERSDWSATSNRYDVSWAWDSLNPVTSNRTVTDGNRLAMTEIGTLNSVHNTVWIFPLKRYQKINSWFMMTMRIRSSSSISPTIGISGPKKSNIHWWIVILQWMKYIWPESSIRFDACRHQIPVIFFHSTAYASCDSSIHCRLHGSQENKKEDHASYLRSDRKA